MKSSHQGSRSVRTLVLVLSALLGLAALPASALAQATGPAILREDDLGKLRGYTFEQRADFIATVRTAAARLDARHAALSAGQTSPARTKALEELKAIRAALDDSLAKAGETPADGWEAARNNVLSALTQLQAAGDRAAKA